MAVDLLYVSLETVLESYSEHTLLFIGDFNTKMGNLNQMDVLETFGNVNVQEERISMHKNTDKRRRKLMDGMERLGLLTFNGRNTGDVLGHYTLINTQGQ